MRLKGNILQELNGNRISLPSQDLLRLPERVLQFGTGVLLRGLPDYFIDKANKQNLFNGRVVMVKSTSPGDTSDFTVQDGLYTIIEKGIENGVPVERVQVNASISRVLSANEQWDDVLACAANPLMQVIISNTTEVGLTLQESDALAEKPVSFPGKLFRFLEERYRVFNGSADAGMAIIPTELIVDNGHTLKQIIIILAKLAKKSDAFIQWISDANDFCNSLVDRIVPGKPSAAELAALETELGYTDSLLITSEPYRLWAIETENQRTRQILSFSGADEGVIIAGNINKYRELKLRLLNATHTLSCGLAHLAGFVTVKEAMRDASFQKMIHGLMHDEIIPVIVDEHISQDEAGRFAAQVIDRFANPYIDHAWLSITMQYSSKMQMRTVPLVVKYFEYFDDVPQWMSLGYAAYLQFMHAKKGTDGNWYGINQGKTYKIQDDKTAIVAAHWERKENEMVVKACLSDTQLFGTDLINQPLFAEDVAQKLLLLQQSGAINLVKAILAKKQSYGQQA